MAFEIAVAAIAVCAVCAVLAAVYAFTRREKKDRHTWINELFGSEEA